MNLGIPSAVSCIHRPNWRYMDDTIDHERSRYLCRGLSPILFFPPGSRVITKITLAALVFVHHLVNFWGNVIRMLQCGFPYAECLPCSALGRLCTQFPGSSIVRLFARLPTFVLTLPLFGCTTGVSTAAPVSFRLSLLWSTIRLSFFPFLDLFWCTAELSSPRQMALLTPGTSVRECCLLKPLATVDALFERSLRVLKQGHLGYCCLPFRRYSFKYGQSWRWGGNLS